MPISFKSEVVIINKRQERPAPDLCSFPSLGRLPKLLIKPGSYLFNLQGIKESKHKCQGIYGHW